jgi:hypothetical protein
VRATQRQAKWINDMNDEARNLEQADGDIFAFEVSDAALEAAASAPRGAAMSLPNAPTVSIVVVCCGNDEPAARIVGRISGA